jgi:hypothetical protein
MSSRSYTSQYARSGRSPASGARLSRLRFVVSSLAIDDFDFHTLIFNQAAGKQNEFCISKN